MENVALHEALKAALAKADNNQSRFAEDIGTSQQLVSYWLKKKRPLPPEFVLRAEAAGYGSRYVLRPDIYPPAEYRTHGSESAIDDELPEDRQIICSVCDERVDQGWPACPNADCPRPAPVAAAPELIDVADVEFPPADVRQAKAA